MRFSVLTTQVIAGWNAAALERVASSLALMEYTAPCGAEGNSG